MRAFLVKARGQYSYLLLSIDNIFLEMQSSPLTKIFYFVPESIQDSSTCKVLMHWLSHEEREKMWRFRAPQHRHAYLVSHALVRGALARELGVNPAALVFETNAYGKPSLASSSSASNLEFNLSHTEGMCVLVLSWYSKLGCDIEHFMRPSIGLDVAENFFCSEELEDIRSHPEHQHTYRLLQHWTLKESYIKAEGLGLSMDVGSFYFHIKEDQAPSLMLKNNAYTPSADWKFEQFLIRDKFLVALAYESQHNSEMKIEVLPADWLGSACC